MEDVRPRAITLMVVTLIMTAALVGQTANLMVRQRDRYTAMAQAQLYSRLKIPAPRGEILDRQGTPLATNRPANVVSIRYPHYKDPELQQRLADLLGIPLSEMRNTVQRKLREGRHYEPLTILKPLTREQFAVLTEQAERYPGVQVDTVALRSYPRGPLAAQVIGYTGTLSPEQARLPEFKDYEGSDLVGQAGLEASYERELRGRKGEWQVEVDPGYRPTADLGVAVEPVPGNSLRLTLDANLQSVAERALEHTMKYLQETPNALDGRVYRNARAGAAVVLDARTGAVLAMASYPSYDLNIFVRRDPQEVQATFRAPLAPMLNRAIGARYYPGSSWKMVTLGAALATGAVRPTERILAVGRYEPTGQSDWRNHGWVDAVRALQVSSNIYFYEMGRRVGIDNLVKFAKGYGFGQRTGIDLEGEQDGVLPDAEWRARWARATGESWTLGYTTQVAIGQLVEVTPLQLARYAAAIGNGGKLLRPYLVDAIVDPGGRVIRKTQPQVVGRLPVPPQALAVIRRGMEAVTEPGGTSSFAVWPLPGIRTAGKTGTAQYVGKDPYGVYVAYAPAEDPEIAVAVVIEQAGSGSAVSHVARTIMAAYFGVQLPDGDPAKLPAEPEPGSPAPGVAR